MATKKEKIDSTVQQIAIAINEAHEEDDVKLTEEEEKLIKLLKKKVKDLEQFAELSRLIHWFHKNYGIGELANFHDSKFFRLFNTSKDSFMILDKACVTALTFNMSEDYKNVSVRFALKNIKPLSKYLENLVINVHFPFESILQLLSKYVNPRDAINIIRQIKKLLILPCSITVDGQDEVIMVIAPRYFDS